MLSLRRWHRSTMRAAHAGAALGLIMATACGVFRAEPGTRVERVTIAFENLAAEPVRVYLVEPGRVPHLLGNVYPMQEANLRMPPHITLHDARQVALVAVPLTLHRPGETAALYAGNWQNYTSVLDLAQQRWVHTSASFYGVLKVPR